VEVPSAKTKNPRPAFLPHPPAGRKPKSRRISKIFSLGFANPPSRKIVSQNRVHFFLNGSFTAIWAVQRSPALSILESSVLCTEACIARAGKR